MFQVIFRLDNSLSHTTQKKHLFQPFPTKGESQRGWASGGCRTRGSIEEETASLTGNGGEGADFTLWEDDEKPSYLYVLYMYVYIYTPYIINCICVLDQATEMGKVEVPPPKSPEAGQRSELNWKSEKEASRSRSLKARTWHEIAGWWFWYWKNIFLINIGTWWTIMCRFVRWRMKASTSWESRLEQQRGSAVLAVGTSVSMGLWGPLSTTTESHGFDTTTQADEAFGKLPLRAVSQGESDGWLHHVSPPCA